LDGRQSVAEIAKELELTQEEVRKNYDELEQKGIVKGATIHINYKGFGYKAVAHVMIRIDPAQMDQFMTYLQKTPEVYSFYKSGPGGNTDVTLILKTLQQLDRVKDAIKSQFSVSEIKTAIWTDVKEMHSNLAIVPSEITSIDYASDQMKTGKTGKMPRKTTVDEVDEKVADRLSEDGRAPLDAIGKAAGISAEAAKRRYEKLKRSGLMKVTIQIDPVRIGYRALGVFFAVTSHEDSFSIIKQISAIPDIISIMKTSGDYDLQIYAMIRDIGHLLSIQDELEKIRGISKMDMEVRQMLNKWPTPRQYISTF